MLARDLSQDLAFALDPVLIAREVGLDPDAWQQKFLRQPAQRTLLNACRQSGKSTVTGILAAHTALYDPGSLTLLLSPTQRQSHELFRKALDAYRAIPTAIPIVQESALRMELSNGSRIVSLPGKETTVRGFSGVRLLAVDEAARVPDELYYSVRPMLAVSGGRLVALSTPFGTRGWWYEAWRSEESWERFEVPASDCPRISEAFLEEERRSMGDWWYRQEYECTFLDAETQPFGRGDVERAFEEEVEAWQF
jgi:hypothetical protein